MNEASPRSPDEPYAFTRDEAVRGALWAWLTFMALMVSTVGAFVLALAAPSAFSPSTGLLGAGYYALITLGYTILIGGGVSLAATIVLAPLAVWVARRMRHSASLATHLTVFALFGAGIGVLAVVVYTLVTGGPYILTTPVPAITIAMTTASVVIGWLRASRHARREGYRPDPRSPIGL